VADQPRQAGVLSDSLLEVLGAFAVDQGAAPPGSGTDLTTPQVAVYRLEARRARLQLEQAVGPLVPTLLGDEARTGEGGGPLSICAARRAAVFVDPLSDSPLLESHPKLARRLARHGLVLLPLVAHEEMEGVLALVTAPRVEGGQLPLERLGPLCTSLANELMRERLSRSLERERELRAKATRELAISRAVVDSLFDGTGDGLALVDGQGRLRRINTVFADLLGVGAADLRGADLGALGRLVASRSGDLPSEFDWGDPSMPEATVGRVELTRPSPRVLEMRASPVRDADHRLSGRLFVAHDATRAEESARMKSEFVMTVSHELRTPLTSLHGALRLLESLADEKTPVPVESPERRFLAVAVRNTLRLIRLLDDILDVSRIETGGAELRPGRFAASEVIRESVEEMRGLASERHVQIRWHCPPDLDIVGDRDRLVQVLVNLISNALKFSEPDQLVSIMAREVAQGIRFSVRDFGRGIGKAQHARIFEKFQQVDSGPTRQEGGTGLGLAISKAIVEEHGGRIWLRSRLGDGSTFYFQIPLARRTRANIPGGGSDDPTPGSGDR